MWVGRINQDLNIFKNDHLKTSVGASYWYSDIENKRDGNNGHRKAWSAFSQIAYNDLQLLLIGGQNHVSTGDAINPDVSTMGAAKILAENKKKLAGTVVFCFPTFRRRRG